MFLRLLLCCASVALVKSAALPGVDWFSRAKATLEQHKRAAPDTNNIAKNVILFIGDGMDITTITASRILRGQLEGRIGEMEVLSFEDYNVFPNVGLSKTHSNSHQIAASASTGFALMSGVKTTFGTVGCGPGVVRGKCETVEPNRLTTILDWSIAAGKSTGIVTNTRITHATPAASYAHIADRNWESDYDMPVSAVGCTDIATQLIRDNPNINVIFGGGRRNFLPNNVTDEKGAKGRRKDGVNLIQAWIDDKNAKGLSNKYITNKAMLQEAVQAKPERVLGLFSSSHMAYEIERPSDEPSLTEMVEAAINLLSGNNNGFFLMVEGGRIDHAHHDAHMKLALTEAVHLDKAIAKAVSLTDDQQTLITVTADHGHGMTMAGYPILNNPILGLVDPDGFSWEPTKDNLPYLTLSYANGPGPVVRQDLTNVDTSTNNYLFPSGLVPMEYETHGGQDVSVYARGPRSHLLRGVYDQNYIPVVLAYASCVNGLCQ